MLEYPGQEIDHFNLLLLYRENGQPTACFYCFPGCESSVTAINHHAPLSNGGRYEGRKYNISL